MLLHAGAPLAPHDLWAAWSFEPLVVLAIAAAAFLYGRGYLTAVSRSTRGTKGLHLRCAAFATGILTLMIALVSPLHAVGGVLFSAHMVQHELLMTIAAPLIVLGRPGTPLMWALPERIRGRVAGLTRHSAFHTAWKTASNPISAWLLHGAAIWVWHVPSLYDASVESELVHSLQHYSFFATALLFWWSVLQGRSPARAGIAVMSLFTTALHTGLLGALLSSGDAAVYKAYDSTRSWGLTPLEDQQLGGIIMWVPGAVPYAVAALFLITRWLRLSDSRAATEMRARPAGAVSHASLLLVMTLIGCGQKGDSVAGLTGGYPERGRDAMRKYGCQSCHSIPGVTGARALVGPPLEGIATRSFIGGVLVNSPANMMAWIQDPPAHAPRTAMPDLGVTDKDARDMTAYLYTLR
jgi:cytochrome c oxidase assembly factor CtaG/cytochrome c2